MARRDERAYPWWICERGATKPGGLLRENPPGGASFVRGQRWLVAYPDLSGRGCSQLAALATAKIRCRRPAFHFDKGSIVCHAPEVPARGKCHLPNLSGRTFAL